MGNYFGLDFGTSNSAIAAIMNNEIRLLDIDRHNPIQNSLKSVLYFIKEGRKRKAYVGYEAVKEYIATGGEGRCLQSIKTFLPDSSFTETEILYKTYTLEELIAFILRTMKERGEQAIQSTVDHVVLGRPVLFSEDPTKDKLAEDRLRTAAEAAGFKNIVFQLEPIAAALSFEKSLNTDDEKLVLVGDFGGGTSDFTIMKACRKHTVKQDRSDDILAVGGIYIGGDLFDSEIMWEKVCPYYGKNVRVNSPMGDYRFGLSTITLAKLKRWHLIPHLKSLQTMKNIREIKYLAPPRDRSAIENLEKLINENYGYLLFQAIEKAKCDLSDHDQTDIRFSDYGIEIIEAIEKKEFEGFIADKVEQIDAKVSDALKDAGIHSEDIDVVFLTGGSSYVPLIRSLFEARFGRDKISQSDAFTSVAFGLGVYAAMLDRRHS